MMDTMSSLHNDDSSEIRNTELHSNADLFVIHHWQAGSVNAVVANYLRIVVHHGEHGLQNPHEPLRGAHIVLGSGGIQTIGFSRSIIQTQYLNLRKQQTMS